MKTGGGSMPLLGKHSGLLVNHNIKLIKPKPKENPVDIKHFKIRSRLFPNKTLQVF